MSRDIYVNGPNLIYVKGMGALSRDGKPKKLELGLTQGPIRIIPNIIHRDVFSDDFGPDVPAEVMSTAADAQVHMTLVHYDESVLHQCIQNSMGNYDTIYNASTGADPEALDDQGLDITSLSRAGYFGGVGKMLGGGKQRFEAGNLYISLSITAQVYSRQFPEFREEPRPYRFPTAYIAANPMEIPLGTERTLLVVRWRAIAYRAPFAPKGTTPNDNRISTTTTRELKSKGAVLWDRRVDTDN